MPIYEYQCLNCGKMTEILQGMNDPAPTECQYCGQPALTRKISAAGFQLKGAGWYVTDYKKPAADASSNPATETKTETKPTTETPTETKTSDTGSSDS
ncbi:MAG: zinc ribbon domain-containing protein [Gammaproteobacteria bacterium]